MKKMSFLFLFLVFIPMSFCQYLTYDGFNIYFENKTYISVFTCAKERCYPGFVNIPTYENITIFVYPVNDTYVDIYLNYSDLSSQTCVIKFAFQKPISKISAQYPAEIFSDGNVLFAISSKPGTPAGFSLATNENQLCLNVPAGSGQINFHLEPEKMVAPFIVNSTLALNSPNDSSVQKSNSSVLSANNSSEDVLGENAISLSQTQSKNFKTDASVFSVSPEYILFLAGLAVLLAVLYFFRPKKQGYHGSSTNYPSLSQEQIQNPKIDSKDNVVDQNSDSSSNPSKPLASSSDAGKTGLVQNNDTDIDE
ncbi:MAG: hypothetical protein WC492_03710 [Candidatus Micrarchaeia archaeon]